MPHHTTVVLLISTGVQINPYGVDGTPRRAAYLEMSYNPRQKSRHACPLFQYLSRQFISSPPSPQFNVVYRDEAVIARFQQCRGERRFLIPVIPLVIVSKIACQRMFQLSDPGVPRTFVEDCSYRSNDRQLFKHNEISLKKTLYK